MRREQKSSALAMFPRFRLCTEAAELSAHRRLECCKEKAPLRPGRNHSGAGEQLPASGGQRQGRRVYKTVSGVLVVGREVVECGERLQHSWSSRSANVVKPARDIKRSGRAAHRPRAQLADVAIALAQQRGRGVAATIGEGRELDGDQRQFVELARDQCRSSVG